MNILIIIIVIVLLFIIALLSDYDNSAYEEYCNNECWSRRKTGIKTNKY